MAYLPGTEVNHDQEGGSSRVRPGHCTKAWLTSTITPNVGNSSAKFLLYGGLRSRLPPLTSLAETFLPQVRCRLYFHIRFLIRISTNAHSNFIFKSLIYVYILYSCVHTPPKWESDGKKYNFRQKIGRTLFFLYRVESWEVNTNLERSSP